MKTLKNYAMALVALAIAATSVTLMSTGLKKVKLNDEPALFWYTVDANGDLGSNQNQNPSVAQTKSESMPGGSKQITSCNDSQPEVCLRGYSSTQTPGSPAGTAPSPDHQINKN